MILLITGEYMRDSTSTEPPGANGLMMVTGRDG